MSTSNVAFNAGVKPLINVAVKLPSRAAVPLTAMARSFGKQDLVSVQALQLAPSNGVEMGHQSWDGTHTLTTPLAAARAYAEAGIGHILAEPAERELDTWLRRVEQIARAGEAFVSIG